MVLNSAFSALQEVDGGAGGAWATAHFLPALGPTSLLPCFDTATATLTLWHLTAPPRAEVSDVCLPSPSPPPAGRPVVARKRSRASLGSTASAASPSAQHAPPTPHHSSDRAASAAGAAILALLSGADELEDTIEDLSGPGLSCVAMLDSPHTLPTACPSIACLAASEGNSLSLAVGWPTALATFPLELSTAALHLAPEQGPACA